MKNKLRANLIVIALLAILFSFSIQKKSLPQQQCGIERWSIKTLSDTDAKKINFTPKRASVTDLASLPKPNKPISGKTARFAQEFVTYQVNCKIIEWILEDDGDYHLVLQEMDDTNKTIIGEIPSPECADAKKSKHIDEFIFVRAEFEKCKLPKGKVKKGIYKIIGTGFFDKIHGAKGASTNGFELHPIIYFAKFK